MAQKSNVTMRHIWLPSQWLVVCVSA